MFFNCNWCERTCCCGKRYEKDCKRPEKNYCNINNKCNYGNENKYDKCDYDRHEKCYCRIEENNCHKNNDFNRFDKQEQYQNNNFDAQGYYFECNNLGYFNQEDRYNKREFEQKDYKEDKLSYDEKADRQFPNWNNDKDCKCQKEKDNICKPIKYICIPFDKF